MRKCMAFNISLLYFTELNFLNIWYVHIGNNTQNNQRELYDEVEKTSHVCLMPCLMWDNPFIYLYNFVGKLFFYFTSTLWNQGTSTLSIRHFSHVIPEWMHCIMSPWMRIRLTTSIRECLPFLSSSLAFLETSKVILLKISDYIHTFIACVNQ